MLIGKLIEDTGVTQDGDDDLCIRGITSDSREVKPGFLFAALPGSEADGAKYIEQAVQNGAVAVLTHKSWQSSVSPDVLSGIADIPVMGASNPRRTLALAASRFYGEQPDTVCAVTGTNGKTSVASFVRQIWEQLGQRSASLGTLGVVSPESFIPLAHTTPEPVELHRILRGLHLAGVNHLALEASSHGLAQSRLDGVHIKAAAFTNLTRDHLNYHTDFDDYFYAKMRLFGEVMNPGTTAVLNADSEQFADVERLCWARGLNVVSVGETGVDLKVTAQEMSSRGQKVGFSWKGTAFTVNLPLAGGFQASNALLAAALCIESGADATKVFDALANLRGAPGRMEYCGQTPSGASVYVDYAHTPDALETVLKALRAHTAGRLHVVIGCGGDRDKGKRPQMAKAAMEFSDFTTITDDNPRREDPTSIRKDMLKGMDQSTSDFEEVGDRGQAIHTAISRLEARDTLVVAGKGHEQGQIIGTTILPFDDRNVVRNVLAKMRSDA